MRMTIVLSLAGVENGGTKGHSRPKRGGRPVRFSDRKMPWDKLQIRLGGDRVVRRDPGGRRCRCAGSAKDDELRNLMIF